jgi:transposase
MKTATRRVDVNLDELDRVLDGARQAPLSEDDYEKLKEALHALAAMLVRSRNTEKTSAVLGKSGGSETGAGCEPESNVPPPPGHGRNRAEAFVSSRKIAIPHAKLKHGDRCPECGKGNVYGQKEPKTLVRIVGQAPLAATVYSLERLRCGACGQVYTAQEPEGVGPEKYDETAAAMIAQLKYGSGTAFYRLEQLQDPLVNTPVRSPIRVPLSFVRVNHSPAGKTILQLRTFAERTRSFLSAEKSECVS